MSRTEAPPAGPQAGRVLAWALGAVVVALVLGALVGVAAGLIVGAIVTDAQTDGWGGLVGVVIGVLVGAATAVLAWVIGLVVGARRSFPRGSRAVPVVLTLGAATLGSVVLIALLDVAGVSGGAVTGSETNLLAILAVVLASAAVYPWWAGRLSRRA